MQQEIASELSSGREALRRLIDELSARTPREDPRVKYWRVGGRTVLLALLALSSLQYYFFDVYLTIMALPKLNVLVTVS